MTMCLNTFHEFKDVFIELEARSPAHFNIPKIHSMQHYIALIRNFGSADGFNTESPERLHIDYAKNAYRASNKKDYTIQMTNWLCRQEAVDRFTLYLKWARDGSYRTNENGSATTCADDDEALLVAHDSSATATVQSIPATISVLPPVSTTTSAPIPAALVSAPNPDNNTYTVARRHLPTLRGIPASEIVQNHNATRFVEAVRIFVANHGGPIIPQPFDGFDLFKRITTMLPEIPQASTNNLKNIIRATPPVPEAAKRLKPLTWTSHSYAQGKRMKKRLEPHWKGYGLLAFVLSSNYPTSIVSMYPTF